MPDACSAASRLNVPRLTPASGRYLRAMGWKPSTLDRIRASLVRFPVSTAYVLWPGLGISDDEDAFSRSEGGDWRWYPSAGTFVPVRLGTIWSLLGPGGDVVGSLSRGSEVAHFVPTSAWRRRGVPDWEVTVTGVDQEGPWLRLHTDSGEIVLRQS